MATSTKLEFTNLSTEQLENLLNIYRDTLAYSMESLARGNESTQVKHTIKDTQENISNLLQFIGKSKPSIRVLIQSNPPGAEVLRDYQSTSQQTPCFIWLEPNSRTLISVSLREYASHGDSEIELLVEKDEEDLKLFRLMTDRSKQLCPEPVVRFELKRMDAKFEVTTQPTLPDVDVTLRGVDRDNSAVSRILQADENGQFRFLDSGQMVLPSGYYRVDGRWYPFLKLFTVSSQQQPDAYLSGDGNLQKIKVMFRLSLLLRVWGIFLLSRPVLILRQSRLVRWYRKLTGYRQAVVVLVTILLLICTFLVWDWYQSITPPPEMVKIQVDNVLVGPPENDPLVQNLQKWFADPLSSTLYGNPLASITRVTNWVPVKRFAIDRYEVTLAQYKEFLEGEQLENPDNYKQRIPARFDKQSYDDLPIIGLNWYDAKAYCESVGKRLPTASEWQAAIGGGTPDEDTGTIPLFPWGNEFEGQRCNVMEAMQWRSLQLLPVRSSETCPLENPKDGCWTRSGTCSMVGNASEWIEVSYINPQLEMMQAIAGGNYLEPGRLTGMVFSWTYIEPGENIPLAGVRCALSLDMEQQPPKDMVVIEPSERSRIGPPEVPYAVPLRIISESPQFLQVTMAKLLTTHSERITTEFWLDQEPVSEAAYQQFIRATAGERGWWSHPRQPKEKVTHRLGQMEGSETEPVHNVDWWDAFAYCSWRGKRLPSNAELEIAYRGDAKTTYPWGDKYNIEQLMNYLSPYGVEGLVSQQTEWTSEVVRNASIPGKDSRSIRGGILGSELVQAYRAISYSKEVVEADDNHSGFRCAQSPRQPMIKRLLLPSKK